MNLIRGSILNLLFGISLLALPKEEMGKLHYSDFKPEFKYLSPLIGFLSLESGIIEYIRFHGNYGEKNDQFLCHNQLTKEQQKKDCPQDNTAAFLQHLFPSLTREHLAISGRRSDFFANIPIKNIGQVLAAYARGGSCLQELRGAFNSTNKNKIGSAWQEALKLNSSSEAYEQLVQHYAQMLEGARLEASNYPPHLIETILLASAVRKAKTAAELEPLFAELDRLGDYTHRVKFIPQSFHIDDYKKFIESNNVFNNGLTSTQFNKLLSEDPEALAYFTLMTDKYGKRYPDLIRTGKAVVQEEKFSDCGENALRNLFNIILSTEQQSFNSDLIKNLIPGVIEFYKKQGRFEQVFSDQYDDLRDQWAQLLSTINGVTYDQSSYDKSLRFDLNTSVDNMMKVIAHLTQNKDLILALEELNEALRDKETSQRKKVLDVLFASLSRPGFNLSWSSQNEALPSYHPTLIISINNEPKFSWKFEHLHSSFSALGHDFESDWRHNVSHVSTLLQDQTPEALTNALLPFYLEKTNDVEEIYLTALNPTKLQAKDEKNRNVLHRAVKNGFSTHLTLLLHKSKSFFSADKKWLKNWVFNADRQSPLHMAVKVEWEWGARQLIRLAPELASEPYLAKSYYGQTALHLALESEESDLFYAVLEEAPQLATQENLLFDNDGSSPLHYAIEQNENLVKSSEISELIGNYSNLVIEPNIAKDGEGKTVLHMMIERAKLKRVKKLLLKYPELVTNEKLILDGEGNSPLQKAIIFAIKNPDIPKYVRIVEELIAKAPQLYKNVPRPHLLLLLKHPYVSEKFAEYISKQQKNLKRVN